MSQQSLILKHYPGDNTVAICDVHKTVQVKYLGACTEVKFTLLDIAMREGRVDFEYLLSDAVKSLNDIEVDLLLKDFGAGIEGAANASVNNFEVGDPAMYTGIEFIITHFHFDVEPITATIESYNLEAKEEYTVPVMELTRPDAPKPKPHLSFELGQRVYAKGHGEILYLLQCFDDASGNNIAIINNFYTGAEERVLESDLLHAPEYTPALKLDEIADAVSGKPNTEEHTGGSSSYYMTYVPNPTTLSDPYRAECNDIIEALELTYAEANVMKAIWRIAAERQGKKKKGNSAIYDAEKIVFFGPRILIAARGGERR